MTPGSNRDKRVTRVCAVPNDAPTHAFAMHPILRYRPHRLRRGAESNNARPLVNLYHSAQCSGLGEAQVERLVGDETAEELLRGRVRVRVRARVRVRIRVS